MVRSVNASLSLSLTEIQIDHMIQRGIVEIPPDAKSIVVFVHGSDSNSLSPRNRLVARALLQRGIGVLLPDLTERGEGELSFVQSTDRNHIDRTASLLTAIIDWLSVNSGTRGLRIGLFGGRTGAAAAMIAAARRPEKVHAVISRGGRPDLAEEMLAEVKAPTLMIVGSKDKTHIDHNRKAGERMNGKPMLEVIQGASHLFGEPGKIEQVASISYLWFRRNLAMCG